MLSHENRVSVISVIFMLASRRDNSLASGVRLGSVRPASNRDRASASTANPARGRMWDAGHGPKRWRLLARIGGDLDAAAHLGRDEGRASAGLRTIRLGFGLRRCLGRKRIGIARI